ncbi:MAG TPA: saccharopine dehydrogenase NADP-binding domain-containing protein [Pseudomonadales bacterium]|nr:saccharopine dehydrogenase NADP-binding domain-containing protein [Pseudomonadales bacterium]
MTTPRWMLYGANGYTGRITAEIAVERGMRPVLAGRRESEIKPIAEKLGLEWRCFSLENAHDIDAALQDIELVLLHAGPFSATSAPFVNACLKTKTHYLDITGEISVFDAIQSLDAQAKAAGVVLMPGVGFDVVPTDCLANMLAKKMPDATHLELAFAGDGGISPGTCKTMVQILGDGGKIRVNGKVVTVPSAHLRKMIRFSDRTLYCMSIPWGDISTAFYSTRIPNIVVYTATPKPAAIISRLFSPVTPLMAKPSAQHFLNRLVDKYVKGPDAAARAAGTSKLWGRVSNAQGQSIELLLDVAEGYQFTAYSSLACVNDVLAGRASAGTQTPAMAFGADFVMGIAGSRLC